MAKGRVQANIQETFDPTTPRVAVTAKPTDSFVTPDAGQGLARLSSALGVSAQTMQQVQPFMQQYAQSKYEEGAMNALTGQEKPSQGYYQIKGYETLNGQLTANREYKEAIAALDVNNLSPEEYQMQLEGITQQFLSGQSENFIKGFAPIATNIETKAVSLYNDTQRALFMEQSADMIGSRSEDMINDTISEMLFDEFDISDVEALNKYPQIHAQLASGEYGEKFGTALRQRLNELQAQGREMGLTNKQVSQLAVNQISKYAVRYGLPELLEVSDIKDSAGIALSSTELSSTLETARVRAENTRSNMLAAHEKAAIENTKARQVEMTNKLHAAINDIVTTYKSPADQASAARALEADLMENPDYLNLPTSTFKAFDNTFTNLQRGEMNFAEKVNAPVYATLYRKADKGQLTFEELTNETQQGNITKSAWDTLYKLNKENQESELSNADEMAGDFFDITLEQTKKAQFTQTSLDVFSKHDQAAYYELEAMRYKHQFRIDNGRNPNMEETNAYFNNLLKLSGESEGILRAKKGYIAGGEAPEAADEEYFNNAIDVMKQHNEDVDTARNSNWFTGMFDGVDGKMKNETKYTVIDDTGEPIVPYMEGKQMVLEDLQSGATSFEDAYNKLLPVFGEDLTNSYVVGAITDYAINLFNSQLNEGVDGIDALNNVQFSLVDFELPEVLLQQILGSLGGADVE